MSTSPDFATPDSPVFRVDAGRRTRSRRVEGEAADPVDLSTFVSSRAAVPEKTRSQGSAGVVNADLVDDLASARAVQVEVTLRLSDSEERRDIRVDFPARMQGHLVAPTARPLDVSAFTASEEAFLRRCMHPALPPAYVDAVIRIVSRSSGEVIGELEGCLDQRTQQLHQAVNVISNLLREKKQLQSKAAALEQTRGNLGKIHATLKGVQEQVSEREAGGTSLALDRREKKIGPTA